MSTLVIDMQSNVNDCVVCGEPSYKMGIPVYEDLVLPNDWDGERGGAPACPRCYELQGALTEPVLMSQLLKTRKDSTP